MLHAAALALAAQHSYGKAAAKAEVSSAEGILEGNWKWQHMICLEMLFVGNGRCACFWELFLQDLPF